MTYEEGHSQRSIETFAYIFWQVFPSVDDVRLSLEGYPGRSIVSSLKYYMLMPIVLQILLLQQCQELIFLNFQCKHKITIDFLQLVGPYLTVTRQQSSNHTYRHFSGQYPNKI
jgi:hypothetical protein